MNLIPWYSSENPVAGVNGLKLFKNIILSNVDLIKEKWMNI